MPRYSNWTERLKPGDMVYLCISNEAKLPRRVEKLLEDGIILLEGGIKISAMGIVREKGIFSARIEPYKPPRISTRYRITFDILFKNKDCYDNKILLNFIKEDIEQATYFHCRAKPIEKYDVGDFTLVEEVDNG